MQNVGVPMPRRASTVLAALGLLAGGLSAVVATAPPAAAETFQERWCSDGNVAPCVLSATRNGVALTSADPLIAVTMIGLNHTEATDYTWFIVQSQTPTGDLDPTDTYSVLIDMGTLAPETTSGIASEVDVDRIDDGDGTYQLRYTGKPTLRTLGCSQDGLPYACPEVATSQRVWFSAEIQKQLVNHHLAGMDTAQNVNVLSGIFLGGFGDSKYLTTTLWNSHFQTDGTTVVKGFVRWRLPYSLLKSDFDIPDPESVVSSSFVGEANNKPVNFSITQDPDGGGVYVDITDVTFSKKKVTLGRGDITPTKPKLKSALRVSTGVAKLAYKASSSRGAKVTRYQAQCTAKGVRKTASAKGTRITVPGLTRGTTYTCRVRAGSKEGYGAWSRGAKV